MNPGACQKCCEVFLFKVCIPGLVWNETRQDGTGGHFPNWRDHDNTTDFLSRCSGKSGKKREINRTGRDYSVPLKKVLSSTELQDFSQKPSISVWEALGNFRVIPNLKQDGKNPVPKAGTESGPGRESSRMLGTLLFPDFYRKNLVPGKWHSGMQTSISE